MSTPKPCIEISFGMSLGGIIIHIFRKITKCQLFQYAHTRYNIWFFNGNTHFYHHITICLFKKKKSIFGLSTIALNLKFTELQ